MECDQARARVSLQLDEELSAHEALLLERHLADCPDCDRFASAARASTALLRAAPLEPSPVLVPSRRPVVSRLHGRAAAVVASAAAAVLVAASAVSPTPSTVDRNSAGAGSSLTGLAVNPPGDANLGVQRPAGAQLFVPRTTNDGARRGLFGL